MTEAVRRRLFAALLWTITALWLLLIWRMSAQTGEQSSGVSGRLAAWLLPGADARAHAALEPLLRKGAHMAEYAVLACLFSLSLQASRVPHPVHAALVCAVLAAALDECHQLFVPGRAGRVRDVAVDVIGSAAGLFLFALVRRGLRRLRRRRAERAG